MSTDKPSEIFVHNETAFGGSDQATNATSKVHYERRMRDASTSMGNQRRTQKGNKTATNTVASKYLLLAIKTVIGCIFCLIVLAAAVFSKLTLVSLTDKLRSVTHYPNATARTKEDETEAVTIFWYLQFILFIPNFVTFMRCLVFGVIGKTTNTFPWPKWRSIILGITGSIVEVFALTSFVYLVLPELSPGVGILLLCGVFVFQIIVDIKRTPNKHCCQRNNKCYRNTGMYEDDPLIAQPNIKGRKKGIKDKLMHIIQVLFENKITKLIALVLQITAIFGFISIWVLHIKPLIGSQNMIRPMLGYPVIALVLSIIWSNFFQDKIAEFHHKVSLKEGATAKFKSSFINSSVRLLLYPLIGYMIFRYASPVSIDPWCLHGKCRITLQSSELSTMIVQVVLTFVGYIVGWGACTMNLSQFSMALPLLLSTPVSVVSYYLSTYYFKFVFPKFTVIEEKPFGDVDSSVPIVLSLLWVGEFLAMGYFLLVKSNIILSKDVEMFLTPHYDGVFFEQHMILNRQTKKKELLSPKHDVEQRKRKTTAHIRNPRTIFICSTMYRENDTEMKQMLSSIYDLAQQYCSKKTAAEKSTPDEYDRYESHIFFDKTINGTQIQKYGKQLLSLLPEMLDVDLKWCMKTKTPYGFCYEWVIGGMGGMPFTVHFKDEQQVKPKKRWSQVMYMNYVIKYRIKKDDLNPNDTFILTTDADIDFTPHSADVLLDMLASNQRVGAVCARTHPKGSGPIYWYQIFDYAIGHWLQKPAEHILGCVLCSPGCFSVFRCTALKDVLEEYSSEAIGANEFLMKDMGEDRWLSTLLIKAGWRLEYCAISEDQTYCPTDFNEFYKQRRRWIPSTIANLIQLISDARSITSVNDSVSILFILFQAIIVFSTAISPATVILFIASGLQSAYNLSQPVTLGIIVLLIIVSVFYGLVCIYGSPQTQIDVAKILTFIFVLIMAVVIVGIFEDTVNNIIGDKTTSILNPPNCANLSKATSNTSSSSVSEISYEECLKIKIYVEGISGSLLRPSKLPSALSVNTIYLGILAVTFIFAAILNIHEWYCLLHALWYLLALPSGYLLLLIYSAANLDNQSWGTREKSIEKDEGLVKWVDHVKRWWRLLVAGCLSCCRKEQLWKKNKETELQKVEIDKEKIEFELQKDGKEAEVCIKELEEEPRKEEKIDDVQHVKLDVERATSSCSSSSSHNEPDTLECDVEYQTMDEECRGWLRGLDCEDYIEKFEVNGYINKHFVAAMELKDFETIGIDKRGFRLRLQKAAKALPSLEIPTTLPTDVEQWLHRLEIPEYTLLFNQEGYKTREDIDNLKDLTEENLRAMGITRRAHLRRLKLGIDNLANPIPYSSKMDEECKEWLRELECEDYVENFEKNGYVNKHFIAAMEPEDFEAIGIVSQGFRLRLQQAAKRLPSLPIQTDVPTDVAQWLYRLEIPEYTVLFHQKGYKTGEDIENLKLLDEENLRAMGISRRAHLQRLKLGIDNLVNPIPTPTDMDEPCKQWLRSLECEKYVDNFEKNGYVNIHFIAAMEPEDFDAISIDSKGLRHRLQLAAKKLPSLPIHTEIPTDIAEWLEQLKIPEYTVLFHRKGYKTREDIENLKDLTEENLRAMGITRRAHLQRLKVGIINMIKPSDMELKIKFTETFIDNLRTTDLSVRSKEEADFWSDLIFQSLRPISVRFQGQIEDMKESLRSLRNITLGVILLINIMWIILLYTLRFPQLEDYGLDSRGFQILFLAVYSFIVIVQFITLVCHRIITLVHYLGRIQSDEINSAQDNGIELVETL